MSSAFRLFIVTDCPLYRPTRLSTIGDRDVPVATARVWNSLPQHVTSATSAAAWRHTSLGAAALDCTHHSYCCVGAVTLSLSDTLIVLVTYLLCKQLSFIFPFLCAKSIIFVLYSRFRHDNIIDTHCTLVTGFFRTKATNEAAARIVTFCF